MSGLLSKAKVDVSMFPASVEWKNHADENLGVILVSGSRKWDNPRQIFETLAAYVEAVIAAGKQPVLIHGAAAGVDSFANDYFVTAQLPVISVPVNWKEHVDGCSCPTATRGTKDDYCRMAGVARNRKMLDMKPDVLVAFISHGDSRGTQSTIDMARQDHLPTRVVYEDKSASATAPSGVNKDVTAKVAFDNSAPIESI